MLNIFQVYVVKDGRQQRGVYDEPVLESVRFYLSSGHAQSVEERCEEIRRRQTTSGHDAVNTDIKELLKKDAETNLYLGR